MQPSLEFCLWTSVFAL